MFIPVDITEEAVELVAHKILGSSGPGGTDLEELQGWLMKFGEDITRLSTITETFVDWLANGRTPWAAYRAFMSGLLIALEKQPVVRLVGVGETWRHLFANIVLKVTGSEETMECQYEQLCTRIKAGIDGVVHGVQYIWDENSTTEDWRFLHLDANNTFSEINRVRMLWTARHLWTSRPHFVFNFYRHWSSLVLQNGMGWQVLCIVRRV